MLYTKTTRPPTSLPNSRGRDAGFVFLFFLSAFWLSNSGFDTSEARYHYRIAQQFITTGNISLDTPVAGIFTTAPNGRTYASHEFGNTLFLIPTAAANEALKLMLRRAGMSNVERVDEFALSFQAGLYAALLLALLYLILTTEYGHSHRSAALACSALAFGTYYWNYSRILFDGVLCALLLIAALKSLLEHRRSGSLARLVIAFVCMGLAVATRLTMVIPAAAAVGFLLFRGPRPWIKPLTVAVISLAPFGVWQMWYNHLRTGSVFLSPVQTPQYVDANGLDGNFLAGITGLLISPGKGLLIYAPLLVVSVLAFPRFWRRDRQMALYVLVTSIVWMLVHAKLRSWYGAWGWGPRHMITMLPLFALPALVHLPEIWRKRSGRILVGTVLLLGGLLASSAVVGNWNYRMKLARQEGRLDDASFVWGRQSQAVDMVIGARQNFKVVAGIAPPSAIRGTSYFTEYASNRINVWWLTLPQAGIPVPVVTTCAMLLIALLIWSGWHVIIRHNF